MHYGDIVIHIDEDLDDQGIYQLEQDLADQAGIYSACVGARTRHLMIVDFDPEDLRPSEIVHNIRDRGFHASMIGL